MRIVGILLVILLVAKDTSHLGDRFIMRGIGQGLCFSVGMIWILMNIDRVKWSKYTLLGMYLFVMFVSAYLSTLRGTAMIQFASLSSVLLFAIAVASSATREQTNTAIVTTTFWAYLIVCVISLLLIKIAPGIAYQVGDIAGGVRFAGLFGRPGMMGAASGILVGIAFFGKFQRRRITDTVRIIAVLVGFACLILCGARTFWIGAVVALALTAYLKGQINTRLIIGFSVIALLGILVVQIADYTISEETKETTLRIESVSTLTGRTNIWGATFEALKASPFVGFGFGVSGDVLVDIGADSAYFLKSHARFRSNPTLHSGYVQAFGDTGYIGGILYSVIMLGTCVIYMRRIVATSHGAECFIIVMLAVANFAESIVFKASTWQSVLFWYLVVLGFTLREPAGRKEGVTQHKHNLAGMNGQTMVDIIKRKL